MKLFVGLGNPTAQYERTRHNVGFRAVEAFAERHRIAIDQKKWNARYGVGEVKGEKVALVLPQTFMNLSGESAGPAMRFFKIGPDEVVALHDEVDLPFGRLQLKKGGGSGGHNGLKSLTQHLGGPDYARLRIGVSRPPEGWETADYVLGKFSGAEEKALSDILWRCADALDLVVEQGLLKAMNFTNRKDEAKPK